MLPMQMHVKNFVVNLLDSRDEGEVMRYLVGFFINMSAVCVFSVAIGPIDWPSNALGTFTSAILACVFFGDSK